MAMHKDLGRLFAVWTMGGGDAGIADFLAGRKIMVNAGPNTVAIDRTIAPTYPGFVKSLKFPQFKDTGSPHVDLTAVIPFFHQKQKKGGTIAGRDMCDFLEDTGLIEHCLDLRFGEELVKTFASTPHLWSRVWTSRAIFLWKSVVLDWDGNLRVPYVIADDDYLQIHWRRLDYDLDGRDPAGLSVG